MNNQNIKQKNKNLFSKILAALFMLINKKKKNKKKDISDDIYPMW